jgi:leucyl aminopeptidase
LKESLKSTVADIKNCGDRYGGAITAALFLSEFIEPGIEWAHLDIAGPATNNKLHPYLSNGGVGFGIRTLIDYLMGL